MKHWSRTSQLSYYWMSVLKLPYFQFNEWQSIILIHFQIQNVHNGWLLWTAGLQCNCEPKLFIQCKYTGEQKRKKKMAKMITIGQESFVFHSSCFMLAFCAGTTRKSETLRECNKINNNSNQEKWKMAQTNNWNKLKYVQN